MAEAASEQRVVEDADKFGPVRVQIAFDAKPQSLHHGKGS
jgi:hypothetical protein